jgi:ectoine hydroxylase-related dioxygenase (phytanoyl-CoA dioxygenase family)
MKRYTAVDLQHLETLTHDGLSIVPSVLSPNLVKALRQELETAIEEDAIRYPTVFDKGMVHNCMVRGANMAALLDNPTMNAYISEAFSATCIVYAYQSSSLAPSSGNYGSRIHVDCPRFTFNYITNMGVIFPLDDFTLENGATYYIPGSHKWEDFPSEDFFYENAKRACCKAGDMLLLNARLVHAAGYNSTSSTRHALTINFCRSFMRQRFDFPRLVPKEIINSLGEDGRRLLGMNVRVPTSLEEFYLPVHERLYKPGQG